MKFPEFVLHLPDWVGRLLPNADRLFPMPEDRMLVAIELARTNVANRTGGPFGAAIFELQTGRLLAPGVNLVVPLCASVAHAEIVAMTLAQQALGDFDLGAEGLPAYELVSSTEPCAMCLGAVPWSGVRRLICGAREEDARRIGFDEGPKAADWRRELEDRGIAVVQDVCRDEAVAVLEAYRESGGTVYNARQGS